MKNIRHFTQSGRTLPLLFIVLVLPLSVAAQRRERLIDNWKPLHYAVEIRLNDQLSAFESAATTIRAVVLKPSVGTIDLDFGSLPVDAVTVNDLPAQFERTPNLLNVRLSKAAKPNEQITITVKYHGKPTDGLILATDRDGKPSATGDNWPDRVHHWIPCLDHPSAKATVSFTITAPSRELVVANGAMESSRGNFGGTTTWSFNEGHPIPPYCMVIVVNEGAKIDVPGALTPLSYYVPQVDRDLARKGFSPAAPALTFFSQLVAPYPYEKLAMIVGATRFGGMENSSAIVFANNLLLANPSARMSETFGIPVGTVDVVAHEIAHQWFGDSVTEATWSDLWLSEGFATYFAGLFIQRHEGEPRFQSYMKQAAATALAYEKRNRTPLFDRNTEDLFKLLNGNNYQKGAWILHMLRGRLGEDAFFRGLRAYYKAHRDATATSEDLRMELEKASGRNLKQFFARWVYGAGHPTYNLSYARINAGSVRLTLKQMQADEPFLDPVPIEITTDKEKKRVIFQPKAKLQTLPVRIKGIPQTMIIDPDGQLLKEVVSSSN